MNLKIKFVFQASDKYFVFQIFPYFTPRMSIFVIDTRREVFEEEDVVDQDDFKNFILVKIWNYDKETMLTPAEC